MLNFFRKIRIQLLRKNQLSRYLIYAFGEIILVVIGILIALQINNSNQSYTNSKKTNTYLKALMAEVLYNSKVLEDFQERLLEDIEIHIASLHSLNQESALHFNDSQLDSVMETWPIYKVQMSKSTFNDLINSGTLEYLDDFELKNEILEIEMLMEYVYETYIHANEVWEKHHLPYIVTYSDVANNWDSIAGIKMPELPFEREKSAFVFNKKFSSILALRIKMVDNYKQNVKEVTVEFQKLVANLNTYLDTHD